MLDRAYKTPLSRIDPLGWPDKAPFLALEAPGRVAAARADSGAPRAVAPGNARNLAFAGYNGPNEAGILSRYSGFILKSRSLHEPLPIHMTNATR
jgi:hypothetical protein